MRIKDWRVAFAFLLLVGLVELSWSACPLLTHDDPTNQREFSNVCQQIAAEPLVTVTTGAPTFVPRKIGDIDIATTTVHVYMATASVTSGSWLLVK